MLLSLAGAACAATSVALGLAGLLLLRFARERQRRTEAKTLASMLAKAAVDLGLRDLGDGIYEGRIRSRRVRWTLRDVEYDHGTRLQLAFGTPVPTGMLGLTHRTMSYGALPPDLELPLCRLGDAEFDVRFFAHADLEHLSLLTPSVRRALLHAGNDAELRIRSGWLWIDHVATRELIADASVRVDWLFKAASAFEGVQAEVEQRVRKMTQDPVPRVRERLLELLSARGASDFTNWIAKNLADDLDAAVRVRAATILGDTGRLAGIARDASIPVEVRRRAGRATLEVGSVQDRIALSSVLAKPPHALPDVALALISDLGRESEQPLIELVQNTDGIIARQAIVRLATLGSARSLVILQAIVDNGTRHEVLRNEARSALAHLRRRRQSNPPEADAAAPAPDAPARSAANAAGAVRLDPLPVEEQATPISGAAKLGRRGDPKAAEPTRPLPSRFSRRK